MKRRLFIQKTSAAALAACLPGSLLSATPPAPKWHRYARPDLLRILRDRHEVAAIGQTYRRLHPEQDCPESLATEIKVSSVHPISEQVRADFGEGRTIQLNGWVLSLTEARQCALYSYLY